MDVLTAVDNKMSKNLFNTVFRFIYIDRRDDFTQHNVNAFFGAVTQFSERNMNSFRPGRGSFTLHVYLHWIKGSPKRFFKKQRVQKRARHLYEAFRARAMPLGHHIPFREKHINEFYAQTSVLSAEEIATVYHPPGIPVGAQKLAPIEVKKSKPPSTLPIIEE